VGCGTAAVLEAEEQGEAMRLETGGEEQRRVRVSARARKAPQAYRDEEQRQAYVHKPRAMPDSDTGCDASTADPDVETRVTRKRRLPDPPQLPEVRRSKIPRSVYSAEEYFKLARLLEDQRDTALARSIQLQDELQVYLTLEKDCRRIIRLCQWKDRWDCEYGEEGGLGFVEEMHAIIDYRKQLGRELIQAKQARDERKREKDMFNRQRQTAKLEAKQARDMRKAANEEARKASKQRQQCQRLHTNLLRYKKQATRLKGIIADNLQEQKMNKHAKICLNNLLEGAKQLSSEPAQTVVISVPASAPAPVAQSVPAPENTCPMCSGRKEEEIVRD
jgi:hypothetical protein